MNRRGFLKAAGAAGCVSVAGVSLAQKTGVGSAEYRMVAATDKKRTLANGDKYLSSKIETVTAYPTKRSAGGLHDFYSQADYFWPDPKNPNGPYINRDGQSNPDKL